MTKIIIIQLTKKNHRLTNAKLHFFATGATQKTGAKRQNVQLLKKITVKTNNFL